MTALKVIDGDYNPTKINYPRSCDHSIRGIRKIADMLMANDLDELEMFAARDIASDLLRDWADLKEGKRFNPKPKE